MNQPTCSYLISGVAALFSVLSGCSSAPSPAATAATPATTESSPAHHNAAPQAKMEVSAPKSGSGIDHPANDKESVSAAKRMLACKWEGPSSPPLDCEAFSAWDKLEFKDKGATLVHFVEDKDPRVNYLGAANLPYARDWRNNKDLAAVVLDSLEKVPSDADYARAIARAAGHIDAAKTGYETRLKKIAMQYGDAAARAEFVRAVQFNNSELFFDTVLGLARTEKDEVVRSAAVDSFWTGTPADKREVVCALWLEKTKDESELIAGRAAFLAGFNPHGCLKEYDALVTLFEQKTKGKLESSHWVHPLKFMAGNKMVPEKNRKALLAIGKRVAEKKDNSASVRADGLAAVAAGDPKGAKAYAKKFLTDPEKWVKEAAERIIAEK